VLSLNARLIVSASIVLAAFLGLAGLALDRAFRDSALARVQDRLQSRVYALIAAAESEGETLSLPEALPESRFSVPQSGVYARVADASARALWRSRSSLGLEIDYPAPALPGVAAYSVTRGSDGSELFTIAYTVRWALDAEIERDFVIQVAEDRAPYEAEIARFRGSLWAWLAGAAIVLLAVQGMVLRWSLAPLRRVTREVAEIETGRKRSLDGSYPRELQPLTQNLNLLVANSAAQLERYRNALGDLAHSLKTPLAVLRNQIDDLPEEAGSRRDLAEQIARMDRTVQYQLQRAAVSGRTALAPSVRIAPVAERIRRSMLKVYADKGIDIELAVDSNCRFRGDEGDLTELLGNLTDNACKWSNNRVRLSAIRTGPKLTLTIEDDGPGLPQEALAELRARGARGDMSVPGQGIGLAIVDELVEGVYGGTLEVDKSALGGASIVIVFEDHKSGNE
jgi:two-component system sensor histidine kinase PhoQ